MFRKFTFLLALFGFSLFSAGAALAQGDYFPPGSPYSGGTFMQYQVYPCDNIRCQHQPHGQRQAVITTYDTMYGPYSMCACTQCGVDPTRLQTCNDGTRIDPT